MFSYRETHNSSLDSINSKLRDTRGQQTLIIQYYFSSLDEWDALTWDFVDAIVLEWALCGEWETSGYDDKQ